MFTNKLYYISRKDYIPNLTLKILSLYSYVYGCVCVHKLNVEVFTFIYMQLCTEFGSQCQCLPQFFTALNFEMECC